MRNEKITPLYERLSRDEEAAEMVRRIFSLTMEGYGPYQISKLLSEANRSWMPSAGAVKVCRSF